MSRKSFARLALLASSVLSAFGYFACDKDSDGSPFDTSATIALTLTPNPGGFEANWVGSGDLAGFDLQLAEAPAAAPPANGGFGLTAGVRNIKVDRLKGSAEYNVALYTYCVGPSLCNTQTSKVTTLPRPRFKIAGAVTGHKGPITVTLGSQSVTVQPAEAKYELANLEAWNPYQVTIAATSDEQKCSIAATGAIASLDRDVTNADIVCASDAFKVGVTVANLGTGPLVLQNNGGDDLTASANGHFDFATPVAAGATYKVTVLTQPADQTCIVALGEGTAAAAPADIVVTCGAKTYAVGGSVVGLSGTLKVQLNGGAELSITDTGSFAFPDELETGADYVVTVAAQPEGQECGIIGGSGKVAAAAITDVKITCGAPGSPVAVSVTGLTGTVKLKVNDGADLTVDQNGDFQFPAPLPDGTTYTVTISAQPDGQICSLTNATGTVTAGGKSVGVACETLRTIGGTVSGLSGSVSLKLIEKAEVLAVMADGAFTFDSKAVDGDELEIEIETQPENQTCVLANENVTVSGNVTDVTVTCSNNAPTTVTLGGMVTGYTSGTLRLRENIRLNGPNFHDVIITADGAYVFPDPITLGEDYDVRVLVEPDGFNCTIDDAVGAGTAAANVMNIDVACVPEI